jgi:hypothetical protein
MQMITGAIITTTSYPLLGSLRLVIQAIGIGVFTHFAAARSAATFPAGISFSE